MTGANFTSLRALAHVLAASTLLACSGTDGTPEPAGGNDTTQGFQETSSADASTDVVLPDLTVKIKPSVLEGNAPLTVKFTAEIGGAAPTEVSYLWSYEDKKSQKATLENIFYTEGTKRVCLKIWRTEGGSNEPEDCIFITVRIPAQLAITQPTFAGSGEVIPGECVKVDFEMQNTGGKIDTPFVVQCVLSGSQEWDVNKDKHREVKKWEEPSFGDGHNQTVKKSYADQEICIPTDMADGDYFLLCKADAADKVGEEDETDNAKFATTLVHVDHKLAEKPELSIPSFTIPADQKFPKTWDDQLAYELTIKNSGEVKATQFTYTISVCPTTTPGPDCQLITDKTGTIIFSLNPGSEVPVARSWPIPKGMKDGNYCLVAEVDDGKIVSEKNETNNVASSATCFDVLYKETKGVDLTITALTCTPTDAVWNGPIVLDMDVTNLGNTESPAWDFEFDLSETPAPTPATKYELCTGASDKECNGLPPIAAGQTVHITKIAKVSNQLPLIEYYCLARLDPNNEISELDEGNNLKSNAQKVLVNSKSYTDVGINSVSFEPGAQDAGQSIKVTYEYQNVVKQAGISTSTAAGVTFCVVLSTDNKTSKSEIDSKKDIVIGSFAVTQILGKEKTSRTDKVVLPLALDHTIGTYYVGVVSDCKGVLAGEQDASNNWLLAGDPLTVINPKGGCFEDGFEPNDVQEQAKVLPVGVTKDLGGCNEEDWYTVPVPAQNTIIVTLNSKATLDPNSLTGAALKPTDLDLSLMDSKSALLDTSALPGSTDTVLAFVVPEGGDYRLRVYPKVKGTEAHYDLTIEVTPPFDGIDLRAAKVDATPTTTFPGGVIYVDWKLVNLGKTPAGTVNVSFYLTDGPTIDPLNDVKIGTATVTDFGGAVAVARHEKFLLPPNIGAGTFQVGVRVDDGNTVVEVNEDNNDALSPSVTIDGSTPCVDDIGVFEPNDDAATARALPVETATYDKLGVCPDLEDWYSLDLPVGKKLVVTVSYTYVAASGALSLAFADKNGAVILENATTGKAVVTVPYVWDAGKYTLRVYNPKKGSKPAPYTYSLKIELLDPLPADVCTSDIYETNNDFQHAQVVGCGARFATACKLDVDWMRFDLPAGQTVTIKLTSESTIKATIFTDPTSGKSVATINGSTSGATKSITAPATGTTAYFVKVDATSSVKKFDYTLFFDGLAGMDLQALDVIPATGAVYQGENEQLGYAVINQCLTDVDGVEVGFYLSKDATLDVALDTFVQSETLTSPVKGKTKLPVTTKITVPFETPKGSYTLFVVPDHKNAIIESDEKNNAASAPLAVKEICIDDDLEPNNVPKLAVPVALGETSNLAVCPYDLDWYTIDIAQGETLTAKATFVLAEGDLDLRVYDPATPSVPAAKALQIADGEVLTFKAPKSGKWLLRVDGLSGSSNAYTLDLSVGCANDGDCDDSDVCTTDACGAGAKCTHVAVVCQADADPCTVEACAPITGCASVIGGADLCADAVECTIDSCETGVGCKHVLDHAPCADTNGCTDDVCDLTLGCTHPNNTATCDDNDLCTGASACDGGSCKGSQHKSCEAKDVCHTAGSCVPETGLCTEPFATAGTPCSDGSLCTVTDGCKDGVCIAGLPVSCDDGKVCTTDACSEADGKCAFTSISGCTVRAVPTVETIECTDAGWAFSAAAGGFSASTTPAPIGPHLGACSLRLGDGAAYGAGEHTATSVFWLDPGAATAMTVHFLVYDGTDAALATNDALLVEASTDDFATTPTLLGTVMASVTPGAWRLAAFDATALSGKKFKLRFRATIDSSANTGAGWLIEQVTVLDAAIVTANAIGVLHQWSFDDGQLAGWTASAPVGGVAWSVDATPADPGAFNGAGSLNLNDGTTFVPNPAQAYSATITSPVLDLTGGPVDGGAVLLGVSYRTTLRDGSSTADVRRIEVSSDGFVTKTLTADLAALGDTDSAAWVQRLTALDGVSGKLVQVRFVFETALPTASGAGWFLDDVAFEVFED